MNAFSRHMRPKDRLISSGYTCWWSAVASNPLLFSDETGVIGLPQYFEPASPPFSWRPIFVRWSCSRWWQAPPWWKVEMWADCSRTHFLPGFRTWWGQVVAAVNAITCNEGKSVKRHIVCWKVYTFQELKNYTMTIAPHCQIGFSEETHANCAKAAPLDHQWSSYEKLEQTIKNNVLIRSLVTHKCLRMATIIHLCKMFE